jgi:hypothetical protein
MRHAVGERSEFDPDHVGDAGEYREKASLASDVVVRSWLACADVTRRPTSLVEVLRLGRLRGCVLSELRRDDGQRRRAAQASVFPQVPEVGSNTPYGDRRALERKCGVARTANFSQLVSQRSVHRR